MSVIPLIMTGEKPTLVTTKAGFEASGGFEGHAVLIGNFDAEQLKPDDRESHLTYDLRVGSEYKDHRNPEKESLPVGKKIILVPGVAVIVATEEVVCLPRSMFGYIVPRVTKLQEGMSNTLSKVDPGYDGRLVVTVFNLGKRKVTLERGERFCSLVLHSVGTGGGLYEKTAKGIEGRPRSRKLQRVFDWAQAYSGALAVLAIVAPLFWNLLARLISWIHKWHW